MNPLDRLRARMRKAVRAPVGIAIRCVERMRRTPFRHELGVCAIFREEAPFLDEWIGFHAGIGATRFYLYNNFSTDNYRAVLAPWIERGLVDLVEWPVPVGQIPAYRDCLKRARDECRWLAFIDIDEFLFSPEAVDIRAVLREYGDLPGLEVWTAVYGSNGHSARPAMPVTQAYCRRATGRQTVKTLCDPRMVYKVGVHQCKYWLGQGMDVSRRAVHPNSEPNLAKLRINHYWSRSLEDLAVKIARNDASTPGPRDAAWHYATERDLNALFDDAILPVARKILGMAGKSAAAGPLSSGRA